jgi:hypothetical protein
MRRDPKRILRVPAAFPSRTCEEPNVSIAFPADPRDCNEIPKGSYEFPRLFPAELVKNQMFLLHFQQIRGNAMRSQKDPMSSRGFSQQNLVKYQKIVLHFQQIRGNARRSQKDPMSSRDFPSRTCEVPKDCAASAEMQGDPKRIL